MDEVAPGLMWLRSLSVVSYGVRKLCCMLKYERRRIRIGSEQGINMGAIHPIDSVIYGERYSDPAMRRLFEEQNIQGERLRFEAVVAEEQAQMGIIPVAAAAEIARTCNVDRVRLERIAQLTAETSNDIVALVRAAGEQMSAEAAEYLHYGLTSQDVHITGQALVLKEAAALLEEGMEGLEAVLVGMADQYRDTVMIGRSYGQHAVPITFGL